MRTGLFAGHRVLLAILAVLGCASRSTTSSTATAGAGVSAVRPGLDQFVANPPEWARGKRIGLITNVAGIDSRGRNNIDLLAGDSRFRLTALFAFEHGLRGDAPAGQPIASGTDAKSREYAAAALASFPENPRSKALLVGALSDAAWHVRARAAGVLAGLGKDEATLNARRLSASRDGNEIVRRAAQKSVESLSRP